MVTVGAGRDAMIDSGSEMVEGDTAIISPEGDKFVNVNGVGLVKDTYLSNQNIIPRAANSNMTSSRIHPAGWIDGLGGCQI